MANAHPLLSHHQFRRFLLGRVLSSLGMQIQTVAVGWLVYDLTRDPAKLGLVGLAQFLPMMLLTLPAGHVADRHHRPLVASLALSVAALASLWLAVGSWQGWITPWAIYLAVGLVGASTAFQRPAMSAMLPGLIPIDLFPRAAALSSSALEAATITGPAVGGLLYGAGPTAPFAIAACLFLASAIGVATIRPARTDDARTPPGWNTVLSGLTFIRDHPVILGAISLDLFAVLLGGATALMPIFARDILHSGPVGLGLLRAGPAIGALLTSFWLARRPMTRRVGRRMFMAVIVFGLATILFGLSRSLPLSITALVILGCADVISVVIRQSLVQLRTPDAMRGRVAAVNFLFIGTSNQFGEFESGMTAKLLGTIPAVLLGGIGSICVALLWMRLFPQLRRMDNFTDRLA